MFFTLDKKRIFWLLTAVILCMGTVCIPGVAGAYESIYVVTGHIQKIEGRVITLEGGERLQPFQEVDIPNWAVVGASATLSYVVRPRGDCYLEIVRPGEPLKVKEALERCERERN